VLDVRRAHSVLASVGARGTLGGMNVRVLALASCCVAASGLQASEGAAAGAAEVRVEQGTISSANAGSETTRERTPRERLARLEQFLNPNLADDEVEARFSEEELLAEFVSLKRATKGTEAHKEVSALEKEYLKARNAAARFYEGGGTPTGGAGRFEGAKLLSTR
jgi:hypothetical protein